MFTGIIESVATVESVENQGSNRVFWIRSPLSDEFGIDQSIAHDGVCLTVDQVLPGKHRVTAVAETLSKTTLGSWKAGTILNLERSMALNGRLDGHIVQGHVDCLATCIEKLDQNGSWKFSFAFPPQFASLLVEKGSVAINGTSLTVFEVGSNHFSVAIIPFTYSATSIAQVDTGKKVNIEFDMIGKYVNRIYSVSARSEI